MSRYHEGQSHWLTTCIFGNGVSAAANAAAGMDLFGRSENRTLTMFTEDHRVITRWKSVANESVVGSYTRNGLYPLAGAH